VEADRHHGEPVEQVGAKPRVVDLTAEVAMGRRDHADVDLDRLRAADPADRARLERAQQLRLLIDRELADLVEEQRAAVGFFERADAPRVGAGERARLVAEQLRLEQRRRDRRAIDRDERPAGARAREVDAFGGALLAGAGLALEEHGRVARRGGAQRMEPARASRPIDRRAGRGVRGGEPAPDLDENRDRLAPRARPREPRPERLALAMNISPACEPTSYTAITFEWRSFAIAWSSRSRRSSISACATTTLPIPPERVWNVVLPDHRTIACARRRFFRRQRSASRRVLAVARWQVTAVAVTRDQ
jgi:hypothetical protein